MADEERTDLSLYGTLVDRQRRLLETLGLGRVARDVTPRPIDMTEHVIEALRSPT